MSWSPQARYSQSPPKGAGPENWCRAKIVEKCRKYFWHFVTILDVFWPCAKNVEKCRKYFWDFLTVLLTFFDVAPFSWPLLRSADTLSESFRTLWTLSGCRASKAQESAVPAGGPQMMGHYRCSRNDYRTQSFGAQNLYLQNSPDRGQSRKIRFSKFPGSGLKKI